MFQIQSQMYIPLYSDSMIEYIFLFSSVILSKYCFKTGFPFSIGDDHGSYQYQTFNTVYSVILIGSSFS